jgi:prepilin-type N-terminal cleavage/methylation domain-containing protein
MQFLRLAATGRTQRGRAFTLVEVLAALFVLALVLAALLAYFRLRGDGRDLTRALDEAPAAVDALNASLDAEGMDAVAAQFEASGTLRRIVCQRNDAGAIYWYVANPAKLTAPLGAGGPVYVATLSNPKMLSNNLAVEFDVSVDWLKPGAADEASSALVARIDTLAARSDKGSSHVCAYGRTVLRKGIVVK